MADSPRKFYHLLSLVWMHSRVSCLMMCFDWCHFLSAPDPVSCHLCAILTHTVWWIKVNLDTADKIYEHISHKSSSFYCNTQCYTTPCFNTNREKAYSWQFLRRNFQKLTEINCTLHIKMGQYSSRVCLHQFMSHRVMTGGWIIDCLNERIFFWISPSIYVSQEEVSVSFNS